MTMKLQVRKRDQVHLIQTCWTTCSCQGLTLPFISFIRGLVQPGDRGDTCVGGPFLWIDDLDKFCVHFGIHGYKALSPMLQHNTPLDPDASQWLNQLDPRELEEPQPEDLLDDHSPDWMIKK